MRKTGKRYKTQTSITNQPTNPKRKKRFMNSAPTHALPCSSPRAAFSSGSNQLSSTVNFTLLTYSFIFSLYNCAASAFAGLFGLGSCNKLCMLVKIAATSYVGDHRFCKISKHSSPFAYTLGWNIRERNLTVGGLFGYDSSNVSISLKVPSSNGVSPGPKMTAFHNMMLSGHGLPDIPPGGSPERRLKSRMRRRLQLVDMIMKD